jgi:hypothetical protein
MNSPLRGFLAGFRVQVQIQGYLTGSRVSDTHDKSLACDYLLWFSDEETSSQVRSMGV